MCAPLLLGAVGLLALELLVMIELGAVIGAVPTVVLVFLTAAIGVTAVRGQGLAVLDRLRREIPADADLLEGPLLVVAALLLVTPGFVTDTLGFLLLVPPVRRAVARRLVNRYGGPRGPGGGETIIVINRR